MISMISAVTKNGVIGHHGSIPWHLPADLRYFKTQTVGHVVVMGRKTFESIVEVLGKPLPDRENVVLTRDTEYNPAGATVLHSIEEARERHPDFIVIGGATLYEQCMPIADRLYVTEVHTELIGDTYFPTIDPAVWTEVGREDHQADEKNQYDYSFVTYERI